MTPSRTDSVDQLLWHAYVEAVKRTPDIARSRGRDVMAAPRTIAGTGTVHAALDAMASADAAGAPPASRDSEVASTIGARALFGLRMTANSVRAVVPNGTETLAALRVHALYQLNHRYRAVMGLDESLTRSNRLYDLLRTSRPRTSHAGVVG